jgi:RNA binding exosome subunit
LKLLSAEISTMLYPSEVEERVRSLILSLCGDCEIKEERISSHYGYSFKVLTCDLSGESAEGLLRRVLCSLNELELYSLLDSIDKYIEGRHLYIRLSKQDLALGRFKIYEGGPGGYIRIKFSFKGSLDIKEEVRKVEESCTQIS